MAEIEYEFTLKDLKKIIEKRKNLWVYIVLGILLIISYTIRVSDVKNLQGKYLLGPDPYLFFRYAKLIIENHGVLPVNDTLRYYPDGFDTRGEAPMTSYAIVFTYYLFRFFNPNVSLMTAAIYFPAIFGGILGMLAFFFLSKEFTKNNVTALVACAFLISIPSYLFRTIAGHAEKEAISPVFIFFSLYFFIKMIESKEIKKIIIYGIISGVLTTISGLSWGGFAFITMAIGIYVTLMILLNSLKKDEYIGILTWFAVTVVLLATTTTRLGGFSGIYKNVSILVPGFSVAAATIHMLTKKTSEKLRIPTGFASIVLTVLILLAAGMIFVPDFTSDFVLNLEKRIEMPLGTDRFTISVSENQQPYFIDPRSGVDWWHSMYWYFFLFFAGAIYLFWEFAKIFGKYKIIATTFFTVFISFFIFSNFSSEQQYIEISKVFSEQYIHSLMVFVIAITGLYLYNWKKIEENSQDIDKANLLLIAWFVISVIGARSAVRVLFELTMPAMIIAAHFLIKADELIKKATKDAVYRTGPYIIIAMVLMWSIPTSYAMGANTGSDINQYEENAMKWIRDNTTKDAVFTHWWDYGYWIQTMGERATTVDGGNYYFWRNYDNARYFMCGYNDSENMKVLKEFGYPNYLFFIDDDIFKFYQMAGIGERVTWFDVLQYTGLYENSIGNKEEYPKLATFESGGILLKEDMIIDGNFYDGYSTYIINVYLQTRNETYANAYAQIYNPLFGSKLMNMTCLCEEGKECSEMNEFPGCGLLIDGGMIFIPKKAMNMTFTRLYLLRENMTRFTLAYENEVPIGYNTITNSYYTNIRIYKINYNETDKL